MKFKYYVTVVTGIVETIVIGAVVFGWSSMNYILTDLGYFNSSCNSTTNKTLNKSLCPTQQYNLELIFTISTLSALILFAMFGYVMDYFGTWILRTFSCLLIVFSSIAVAFSNPNISWILYPGILLFNVGGQNLFLTNMQTANLLPKFRGLIANLVSAATEVSIVMFTFAKIAFDHGVSFAAIYLFFGFLGILSLLRTFLLMPKMSIPYHVPVDYYYGIKECCSNNAQLTLGSETELLLAHSTEEREDKEKNKETSLKSCIFSSIYLIGLYSFSVQSLRLNFFIEELNSWLFHLLHGNKSLYSSFINIFGFVQFSALLLAILNGLLFDYILNYYKNKDSFTSTQANLRSLSVVCFIGSSSSITYSIFALIPVPSLQYASFVLFVAAGVIVWANMILLVVHCFPMKYFGTLFGLAACIEAVISISQFLLLYIAIHYFNSSFVVVNSIVLVLCIFSLAHPINLYRCSKKD